MNSQMKATTDKFGQHLSFLLESDAGKGTEGGTWTGGTTSDRERGGATQQGGEREREDERRGETVQPKNWGDTRVYCMLRFG